MARFFRSPPRVPASSEVDACLALLDTEASARDHLLIAMAAWTGLRVSEMVALDWPQVVTEAENIRHRVVLVSEHTKGGVGGSVVLPERLRWRIGQYRMWCARRGRSVEGHEPIFNSRNNRRISVRRVQQVWRQVQVEAGIDRPHRLHGLRHFFATKLYAASKDIRLTQIAMRHASVTSTMIYSHVSNADVEQAVERAF